MTEEKGNGANLGFENQLWAAADKLRGHMDASEYKQLEATKDTEYTDPEDRDKYSAGNIF